MHAFDHRDPSLGKLDYFADLVIIDTGDQRRDKLDADLHIRTVLNGLDLHIKKIRTANLLPALFVAPFSVWLMDWLGIVYYPSL